jgi:hypothetical protein
MIDQTVPLRELTAGMARCLREWILPHLHDPAARTQAETLAALLEALPGAVSAEAQRAILDDSAAARALLRRLGESADDATAGDVDAAVRDNSALKARLQEIAERLRAAGTEDSRRQLEALQRFFLESMRRELDMVRRGADFAAMTAREDAARRG